MYIYIHVECFAHSEPGRHGSTGGGDTGGGRPSGLLGLWVLRGAGHAA